MALEARKRHTPKGQVEAGARFWIRALARIIDIVLDNFFYLFGTFLGALLWGVLIAMGAAEETSLDEMSGLSLLSLLLAVLAGIGYHAISEGFGGATPGKWICGLRVIGQREGPCRFGPAVLRSFAYLFDALFFGAVGYLSMSNSPLRQRFGDKWGKTVVAKTAQVPEEARRSGLAFTLAWMGGAAFSAAVACVSFLLQVL